MTSISSQSFAEDNNSPKKLKFQLPPSPVSGFTSRGGESFYENFPPFSRSLIEKRGTKFFLYPDSIFIFLLFNIYTSIVWEKIISKNVCIFSLTLSQKESFDWVKFCSLYFDRSKNRMFRQTRHRLDMFWPSPLK